MPEMEKKNPDDLHGFSFAARQKQFESKEKWMH